jgi:hypothetical protein
MKILERLFAPKPGRIKNEQKKAALGRNENCWCGSGKKYKRCHLDRDDHKRRMSGNLGKKKT